MQQRRGTIVVGLRMFNSGVEMLGYIPHRRKRSLIQNLYPQHDGLALRSGITVASEVHPRRGYC